MVRVKICGLTTVADAIAACEAGADAIGLNLHVKSPRYVSGAALNAILREVPPYVTTVAVFGEPWVSFPVPLRQVLESTFDAIQLHGDDVASDVGHLGCALHRAIRLTGEGDLAQLDAWEHARAFVLDGAGKPGEFGGATFDWSLFQEARKRTKKSLVLAGGLTPDNVAEAIRATRPDAVDVASGVESEPGRKDHGKLRAFVQAVRSAG